MIQRLLFLVMLFPFCLFAQQTKVSGRVTDGLTGEPLPFVKVRFYDSKIGTMTDTSGYYEIESYYATDSLQFYFSGYITQTVEVQLDAAQTIHVVMPTLTTEVGEVFVRPPDEFPSTTLHKKVVKNKPINNKEKLSSYEYELYNKIQFDLNNIGDKFTERGVVKRLDLVMEYLDSADNGKSYLPVILSEALSDYYFKNNPKRKKEVMQATHITGIENIQLNQFMGDMYVDINVYDNYINMFNKAFVSPIADFARSYYKFYLEDSTFIDNQWCYKLTFTPKRTGDMTFEGELWIHDTTYAVKQVKGNISPWANINYIQDMYFEQNFEMVQNEVWMMTTESIIADFKLTKNTDLYGFYARKQSSRKNFKINNFRPDSFYKSDNTVEIVDSANIRSDAYWSAHRHMPLTFQEDGIGVMMDSLNNTPFFKRLKTFTYLLTTGYFQINKIEIGNIYNAISFNPVEGFRSGIAIRTSNNFSRRIEFGGKLYYGVKDDRFKYGGSIRYNITPKKRGMLTGYYNYDIEQIGASPSASTVGSTFGTVFRTGPLDKLTFVQKTGLNLEKDIKKDVILFGGFEWKEYVPLGLANYLRINPVNGSTDTISKITSSEITARFRWAKDEEFISGAFDRTSIKSRYPILSVQGIFGVKGLLGSDYEYQKLEVSLDHSTPIGVLGNIRYGINGGKIFGTAAYPFLKVHEGNQSYFLYKNTFNMLNFFEFISDQYVGAYLENHWQGLFFDRIPLVKKLKWRLVTTARATYGSIDQRHSQEMILPTFTKKFGDTPYVEFSAGIENILKLIRVDVFYRASHQIPGSSPWGIRARWEIYL